MHESVAAHRVAGREDVHAAFADELMPPAQLFAARLDLRDGLVQRRGDRDGVKLRAGDARGLQDAPIARVETIDLRLDQLTDGVGYANLHGVERRRQTPPVVARLDEALGDQVLDRVHHEERTALGPFVDERGELAGEGVAGKSRGDLLATASR